ncbi:MAG: hypothetical protein JRN23_06480, partial [Nitrososphaerota archaeon]|nr:hypothetical protein [Nitrososphaerota archaeon]
LLVELSKESTINRLLFISLLFLGSGFLDVAYIFFGAEILLAASWLMLYLAIVAILMQAVWLLYLISFFLPRARSELGGFTRQVEQRTPRKKHDFKCELCGRSHKSYKELSQHLAKDCPRLMR